MHAIEGGQLEIVKLLVYAGANINEVIELPTGKYKSCPVLSALAYPEILEFLVISGADVNIKLGQKRTPLHFAAEYHKLESADILIKYGADVNSIDLYGKTPFHLSINHKVTAFFLLANGADFEIIDHDGWKPLHRAYQGCQIDIIKELLARGGATNEFPPDGRNALHNAVLKISYPGVFEYIKFLIEDQNMNINEYTQSGGIRCTPIMHALQQQNNLEDDFEILNYLIKMGANLNATMYSGNRVLPKTNSMHSILAWARSQNVPRYVIEWMVQNGAQ